MIFMNKKERKIFDKIEKHFIRLGERRITYYDRKKIDKKWNYFYIKRWNKRSTWDKLQENLINKPEVANEYRKVSLSGVTIVSKKGNKRTADLSKLFLKPSKLKYTFRTKDRVKHKTVFLAYTKNQIKDFRELRKKRKLPIQISRGKIKKVIDLSYPYREVEITESVKTGESP